MCGDLMRLDNWELGNLLLNRHIQLFVRFVVLPCTGN